MARQTNFLPISMKRQWRLSTRRVVPSPTSLDRSIARSLEVSDRTLWYWVNEDRKAHRRANDPTSLNADDAADLKRLRKENAQQREDMEILR